MTDHEEAALRERVQDLTLATLHLFTLFTGQPVNELALRNLIEKLGAHTRTNTTGLKL